MGIIRYNDSFDDWLEWFDGARWLPSTGSWTWRYKTYDPEKYELIVREDYKKELIAQKEKEIESLDKRKKELTEEVGKLKAGKGDGMSDYLRLAHALNRAGVRKLITTP